MPLDLKIEGPTHSTIILSYGTRAISLLRIHDFKCRPHSCPNNVPVILHIFTKQATSFSVLTVVSFSVLHNRVKGRGFKSNHGCSHTVQKPSISPRLFGQCTLMQDPIEPFSNHKRSLSCFFFFILFIYLFIYFG